MRVHKLFFVLFFCRGLIVLAVGHRFSVKMASAKEYFVTDDLIKRILFVPRQAKKNFTPGIRDIKK